MYRLSRALVRLKGRNSRWQLADLSTIKIVDIYSTYRNAILIMTNDFLVGEVALDLEAVRLTQSENASTVAMWLATLGNASLPTSNVIPTLENKTVLYSDAWRCNYDIQLADNFAHPDSQIPNSEKEDIILSREGVDYDLFYKHCLVTVNGLVHQTNKSIYGVYVTEGGKTGRKAKDNRVGILSFLNLGELQFVPMTDAMIYKTNPEQELSKGAYVDLGFSTEGKTVLLVLGGYLHVLDNVYQQINDRAFKINFANINLAQRYFDSVDSIDLSSLGLTTTSRNLAQVANEELYSDAAIRAYLKLKHSFFVIVDTPELYVEQHKLSSAQLPGRYLSGKKPMFPVFNGLGRMTEYWSKRETDTYVISCQDNLDTFYHFETQHHRKEHSIAPHRQSYRPFDYSQMMMMEIGKEF